MTKAAAARIQSGEGKKTGGQATEWSKRAQSAADKNQSWLVGLQHEKL